MGQIGTPVVRQNNKKGESEMTHAKDDSAISMALKQIIAKGFKGLDTALSILINEAMRIERGRVFEAEPLQRTQTRKGCDNGYKPKTVKSKVGELALQILQLRAPLQFYPNALEKGLHSERELKLPMAEMYINGVSTSKINEVLKSSPSWRVPAPRSAGPPGCWRRSLRSGATALWVIRPMSSSMPATKRFVTAAA